MSDHYDRYNGMEELLGTNLAEVGTDVHDINVGELISRQAAIDALENDKEVLDHIIRLTSADDAQLDHYVAQHNQVVYDIDVIKQLPPIQPKRGKWERHYSRPNVYADLFWHCSECGYRSSDNWADKFNFCPHCGADMRGDKNA